MILTAAFAGWSGISVHCQVMTLCGGRGLSFRPYLLAKAFQGLLCGVVTWGILRWFPSLTDPGAGVVADAILVLVSKKGQGVPALLANGLFLVGWVVYGTERLKKNRDPLSSS